MDENEEVCVTCEVETDLNDDGYCESCQLDRDILLAERRRDIAEGH